jgi:hypothetical protein
MHMNKRIRPSVGATFMIARGWGVLPIHLAHSKEQGHAPIPAGDHEGRPYGSSGLRPLFMASVDAYWATLAVARYSYHQYLAPLAREAI